MTDLQPEQGKEEGYSITNELGYSIAMEFHRVFVFPLSSLCGGGCTIVIHLIV